MMAIGIDKKVGIEKLRADTAIVQAVPRVRERP